MSRLSLSALSALVMGSSAITPAASEEPDDKKKKPVPPAAIEEDDDAEAVVSVTDAVAAANAARTEGFAAGKADGAKEAGARYTAVLTSDAGKANAEMALFMLTETGASAEVIIDKLGKLPAGSSAAAAPAAPAAGAKTLADMTPAERIAATTPTIDLGSAAAAHASDDNRQGGGADLWASILPGKEAGGEARITDGGIAGAGWNWGASSPKGMEAVHHGC